MKSEGRRTNDIRSVLRLRTYVVAMVIIALDTAYIATRRCASTKRAPPHQSSASGPTFVSNVNNYEQKDYR